MIHAYKGGGAESLPYERAEYSERGLNLAQSKNNLLNEWFFYIA